ncbi:hypothetical protein MASR1M8_07680 [Thermomonas brevis]
MRPTLPRLLLCLSLLGFGSAAMAAEARHMGPDGGGAQSDANAGNERIDDDSDAEGSTARRNSTGKAKQAAPAPRSGSRNATPRWHSFLPGMIR